MSKEVYIEPVAGQNADEKHEAIHGYKRRTIEDVIVGPPVTSAEVHSGGTLIIDEKDGTTYGYLISGQAYYSAGDISGVLSKTESSVLRIPQGTKTDITLTDNANLLVIHETTGASPLVISETQKLTIVPPTSEGTSVSLPPVIMNDEPVTFTSVSVLDVQPIDKSLGQKVSVLGNHSHPRPEVFMVTGNPVVFESEILDPNGQHSSGKETHIVEPNSLVVIPPNVAHSVYNPDGKPYQLVAFTTQFDTVNPDFTTWNVSAPSESAMAAFHSFQNPAAP